MTLALFLGVLLGGIFIGIPVAFSLLLSNHGAYGLYGYLQL